MHDGAQQRLVSLALQLRLVKKAIGKDDAAAESLLTQAEDELERALGELRELARAPIPVEVTELPTERLPEAVEAAVYYLIAEAITNVAKYAQATRATVAVERWGSNGYVTVGVEDDGVGGADPERGTGLVGLTDRIEALGGRLEVESPRGQGTRLVAEIPCN